MLFLYNLWKYLKFLKFVKGKFIHDGNVKMARSAFVMLRDFCDSKHEIHNAKFLIPCYTHFDDNVARGVMGQLRDYQFRSDDWKSSQKTDFAKRFHSCDLNVTFVSDQTRYYGLKHVVEFLDYDANDSVRYSSELICRMITGDNYSVVVRAVGKFDVNSLYMTNAEGYFVCSDFAYSGVIVPLIVERVEFP